MYSHITYMLIYPDNTYMCITFSNESSHISRAFRANLTSFMYIMIANITEQAPKKLCWPLCVCVCVCVRARLRVRVWVFVCVCLWARVYFNMKV